MMCRRLIHSFRRYELRFIKPLSTKVPEDQLSIQLKSLNDAKQFRKTLELFDKYKGSPAVTSSTFTILQVLKACAQTRDYQRAVAIHRLISPKLLTNTYIMTSLIHLYIQCGDIARAKSLFDTSKTKTLAMYGAMIKGYVKNNEARKAIDLYNEIQQPDQITTTFVFNAYAQLENDEALNAVKKIFEYMPEYFKSDHILLTALLDALMKCGDRVAAEALFNSTKRKTLAMYGAMMTGYVKHEMSDKAIALYNEIPSPDEITTTLLFNACAQIKTTNALDLAKKVANEMPKHFRADRILLSSLMDALIKCGDSAGAEVVFSSMRKCVILFGNLMSGFLKESEPEKVLQLFEQMKTEKIVPNEIIYLIVIKALSHVACYDLCQSIVEQIPESILKSLQVQNCLIHMWGKIGYADRAKEIFDSISEPDRIGYTAMINAYGLNGMGVQAVELYSKMPNEFIHEATHVSTLNACSHSGLIAEARSIFKSIENKTLKIYTVMIDCLARGSLLDEAEELINEFERQYEPSYPMYMALLSAARNAKNHNLSERLCDRVKIHFPHMNDTVTAATVLLANTYALSGEIDMASLIRQSMTKSGAKKKVGLSWTFIGGKIFKFRASDQSHPRSSEIYAELDRISNELLQHGYTYDSSWITRPLNPEETVESVLCAHSERLAIALNFVENPHTSLIEIKKNLRVCGDCHRATKLIAAIRQCDIIVRDANRVHHFYKNGKCSCNDYF